MEEPRAGVVRDDAHRDGGAAGHLDRVATRGVRLALVQGRVERGVARRVVRRAPDELELVPVQVAGVHEGGERFYQYHQLYARVRARKEKEKETHKGCLPVSPFLSTMSTTERWSRTKL